MSSFSNKATKASCAIVAAGALAGNFAAVEGVTLKTNQSYSSYSFQSSSNFGGKTEEQRKFLNQYSKGDKTVFEAGDSSFEDGKVKNASYTKNAGESSYYNEEWVRNKATNELEHMDTLRGTDVGAIQQDEGEMQVDKMYQDVANNPGTIPEDEFNIGSQEVTNSDE